MTRTVDDARSTLLFGVPAPADVDLADPQERARLLDAGPGDLRLVLADQVFDDSPAQVWATATRLLADGSDRDAVLDQLLLALAAFSYRDEGPFDTAGYVAALDRLPMPDVDTVSDAYLELARRHVVIAAPELERLVAQRLELDPADPLTAQLLAAADQDVLDDDGVPVTMLAPDVVVHVPALLGRSVLTHRLTTDERAQDRLDLDADLGAFRNLPQPRLGGAQAGELILDDGADPVCWLGPDGWLSAVAEDALLAVGVGEDGAVLVEVLDAPPATPPGLVAALRAVYERELAEPGLPVDGETLVLGMLHDDREAFAAPRPPLAELAAEAGLQRRGPEFAHAESVWIVGEEAARHYRLIDRLGPGEHSMAALEGIDLLATRSADPAALRRALDLLAEPDVLVAALEEWLGVDDDPAPVASLVALGDALIAAAGRSPRAAVARAVASYAAERDGRVHDAESHLRAAVAEADGWPFAEDRLAWFESDRGDAAAALARWRGIGMPGDDPEARALAPFAATGPEPGRNEPCPCGSGRKFKQCHLGRPVLAPLPDRVGWLCRKAVQYLDRRGGAAEDLLLAHAELRSPDLTAALADPLVHDVTLHEGGWWERFLAERGPLLPADEAELAASWLPVPRTLVEVAEVEPGSGFTVRDRVTGARTAVTERALSRTVETGQLLCGRLVPDGAGHQLVGAVLTVPPERADELVEVLELGDGAKLLLWAAPPA